MIVKHIIRIFTVVLLLYHFTSAVLAESDLQAVAGIASGNVQKVGFRAMILKQAIRHNLAGSTKNLENGTVHFFLQGDASQIEKALGAIREGTRKSSNVKVETFPTRVDGNLRTFTITGWTSSSRRITTPYNLVYTLRPVDISVSKRESKKIYRHILRNTLNSEDLKKLGTKED